MINEYDLEDMTAANQIVAPPAVQAEVDAALGLASIMYRDSIQNIEKIKSLAEQHNTPPQAFIRDIIHSYLNV